MRAALDETARRREKQQQYIFLLNKADAVPVTVSTETRRALSPLLSGPNRNFFIISAREKVGLEDLRHALTASWHKLDTAAETTLVANIRHLEALQNAAAALARLRNGLSASIPTDLAAQDLREALYHLGSIVGQVSDNEILRNIFEHFCIGK